MKVIIINGSYRKGGITAAALHMIEADLNEKGVETAFYNLGEISMSHCMGCCTCYRTGHCGIKDDAERISEIIAEADGVILGTPTYASNVSGLMKDLIDRGHSICGLFGAKGSKIWYNYEALIRRRLEVLLFE